MSESEQTQHLAECIQKQITYHRREFNMTLASVVGVLHVLATELIMEAHREDEEE